MLTNAHGLQIKLLKTLALLGAGDKAASENMYAVVGDAMRRANTGHTIGNAIEFECVRTIAAIFPNPGLLQSGAPAERMRVISTRVCDLNGQLQDSSVLQNTTCDIFAGVAALPAPAVTRLRVMLTHRAYVDMQRRRWCRAL